MIRIEHFTDPACPFAFSAEPVRLRLRWLYGDGLRWTTRMIVLTREAGEAEKLSGGSGGLQRKYGMPIDPAPHARPFSTERASLAVVAARLHAPEREDALLRHLRVRTMRGELIDEAEILDAAARDAGIDSEELGRWTEGEDARAVLEEDVAAARSPTPAAHALDHKLSGPDGERRYSAPTYILRAEHGDGAVTVPGFNPAAVYETAIANLEPGLARRPEPESVVELLGWADYPLATAEVEEITGMGSAEARSALAAAARPIAAGAEFYWQL